MKVLLIGPAIEENLSISYLYSAVVEAGHTCRLMSFNNSRQVEKVARAVLACKPDLLGLSLVAQCRYPDFQKLVTILRKESFEGHITAGGHFASLRAGEVLLDTPQIDSILHHDGEKRIVDLLDTLEDCVPLPGNIDGITWRGKDSTLKHVAPHHVADLDHISFPARRRPDKTLGQRRAPVVTSRGCSGSCSFCSIHAWHKQVPTGRLRFRSPQNVADEIISLYDEHGVRVFVFHDDDFLHPDKRRTKARCEQIFDLAERGIDKPYAFVIKCRPDDVEEELFGYLHARGLVRAYVGIETHAASGLSALNRHVTPERNLEALDILKRLGVYGCFNLLVFHPDSTMDELRENLAFLRQQLIHPFDIARTELYARSTLEQRMIHEGRALGSFRGYDYRISNPQVETVFQQFSDILWKRHFGGDSILHRVQDLGYRLSLLSHFHPEAASPDLARRVSSLIQSVNAATVDHLESIIARDSVDSLRQDITSRVRSDTIRWASLSLELESRAFVARTGLSHMPSSLQIPRYIGRLAAALPSLGLMFGTIACGEHTTVCDPPPPPIRTFAEDIEPVLNQSCAVSSCHSAETESAGLDLTSGTSYEHIVNIPSTQAPALDRIEPGNEADSYLVHKLRGTQADVGGSGDRMPPGGEINSPLIHDLESWIWDGSEDN
jgi:radical SAM superfamily enzyme YgiQ (UPF0313 family)